MCYWAMAALKVKGPQNKSGEIKDRFDLSPPLNGERTKMSKPIKLLHHGATRCNNSIDCLSVVLNSQQSGQLSRRGPRELRVLGLLASDVAAMIPT